MLYTQACMCYLPTPQIMTNESCVFLIFMCPCIASIILITIQQEATILDLFISEILYMFQAVPPPIIRSA